MKRPFPFVFLALLAVAAGFTVLPAEAEERGTVGTWLDSLLGERDADRVRPDTDSRDRDDYQRGRFGEYRGESSDEYYDNDRYDENGDGFRSPSRSSDEYGLDRDLRDYDRSRGRSDFSRDRSGLDDRRDSDSLD